MREGGDSKTDLQQIYKILCYLIYDSVPKNTIETLCECVSGKYKPGKRGAYQQNEHKHVVLARI